MIHRLVNVAVLALAALLCLAHPARGEEVTGTILEAIIDYRDGTPPEHATFVQPAPGEAPLQLDVPPHRFHHGQKVRVKGERVPRGKAKGLRAAELAPVLAVEEIAAEDAAPPHHEAAAVAMDTLPAPVDVREVVTVVSFTDVAETNLTPAVLRASVDALLTPYFAETSHGVMRLVPTVPGATVQLGIPHTIDMWTIVQAAVKALDPSVDWRTQHGISIQAPVNAGWGGVAFIGPAGVQTAEGVVQLSMCVNKSTLTTLNKTLMGVNAHEIGHGGPWSLPQNGVASGLHHSGSLQCGSDASIRPAWRLFCGLNEYGGPGVMGHADWMGPYESVQKFMAGWLPLARVRDVTAAGDYDLECHDILGLSGVAMLRVPVGVGDLGKLIIDCRSNPSAPGLGQFAREQAQLLVNWSDDWDNGVMLWVLDQHPAKPILIDTSPETGPNASTSTLPVGRVFRHPVTGMTVEVLSRSATGARVRINPGVPDFTIPVGEWIEPLANSCCVHVSGTYTARFKVTDNDLQKVTLEVVPKGGTLSTACQWFTAESEYRCPIDTTRYPTGYLNFYLSAVDGANNTLNRVARVVWVDNGATPTTTTSSTSTTTTRASTTSTSTTRAPTTSTSTTSTTRPPTTTTPSTTTTVTTSTTRASTTSTTRPPCKFRRARCTLNAECCSRRCGPNRRCR
jgi:hypothetical protein